MIKEKSKGWTRGQTIPLMTILGAICTWCVGLSISAFNMNGSVSGLTASVGDIKDTLASTDLPSLKAEIDFLAKQRGYKPPVEPLANATSTNQ